MYDNVYCSAGSLPSQPRTSGTRHRQNHAMDPRTLRPIRTMGISRTQLTHILRRASPNVTEWASGVAHRARLHSPRRAISNMNSRRPSLRAISSANLQTQRPGTNPSKSSRTLGGIFARCSMRSAGAPRASSTSAMPATVAARIRGIGFILAPLPESGHFRPERRHESNEAARGVIWRRVSDQIHSSNGGFTMKRRAFVKTLPLAALAPVALHALDGSVLYAESSAAEAAGQSSSAGSQKQEVPDYAGKSPALRRDSRRRRRERPTGIRAHQQ